MSRTPKCKTCVSYSVDEKGCAVCEYSGHVIERESSPLYDNGQCYERRSHEKLSPSELSLARSNAGKKGGRTAGYGKGRSPTKQMSVRLHDYNVFSAYAKKERRALAEQFHVIMRQVVTKYPELKPDGWID